MKKTARILVLAVMLCAMLAVTAFAANSGSLWLSVEESSIGNSTAALVITDTTVTDGVITLTYDSTALAYDSIQITDAYVAMYAVNAETPGVVRISWVAPGVYDTNGSGVCLLQVNFSGTGSGIALNGEVYDADRSLIVIGSVDTTELEKAIEAAEALDASSYTETSYAALAAALRNAKDVLENPTSTQSQINAATAALAKAVAALELKDTAGETTPAETAPGETDPAESVPGTDPTESVPGGSPGTGDNSSPSLMIALFVISAVGIVAAIILLKKKDRKGRDA